MVQKLLQDLEDSAQEDDSDSVVSSSSSTSSYSLSQSTFLMRQLSREGMTHFQDFGLVDLQNSNLMSCLSAWHTVVLWLTACILLCEVLQKLLKGYVLWMEVMMSSFVWDGEPHYVRYAAVLVRSWFVVLAYSDLARFCFWLMRDAWRADAFESYRRAVCGEGKTEMLSGVLYLDSAGKPCGWPAKGVSRATRLLDLLAQLGLYVGLDVWPLASTLWELSDSGLGSASFESFLGRVMVRASMAAFVHVVLYKLAWTCTDMGLKAKRLRRILARYRLGGGEGDSGDGEDVDDEERERTGSCFLDEDAIAEVRMRLKVSTEMNLCHRVCGFATTLTPHALWLLFLALGAHMRSWTIVLFALALLLYHFGAMLTNRCSRRGRLPAVGQLCPERSGRHAALLRALQRWGEEDCGLAADQQLLRRFNFVVMVGLQATLFMFMDWRAYVLVCLFFVGLQLVQLTVPCQAPYGWLGGLLEALATLVFSTSLAMLRLPTWKQAGETVLFVLAHQCGLSRRTYYGTHGYKVVRLVFVLLFAAITIVVAATTYAADPTRMPGSDAKSSVLGNVSTYYTVPWQPNHIATNLDCPSWFSLGNRLETKLSLIDFGLLSLIAYEPEETMEAALGLFFPGWRLRHSKRFDIGDASGDWTTFFEFESPNSGTSIFAVRGTASPLDALNDMVIWMPAAMMQLFNLLGPNMLPSVVQAVQWLSSVLGHLENRNYRQLQEYVLGRMREEGRRREFYITGHSLGGGLAKIVALKALTERMELPAITFMSPGTEATQYVVEEGLQNEIREIVQGDFGETAQYLRERALTVTVMPANDVVSRIDAQTGQVVPIGCSSASPLRCHSMGTGLCQMFRDCGSGRRGLNESLRVPCGLCEDMPCVPGSPELLFRPRPQAWKQRRR